MKGRFRQRAMNFETDRSLREYGFDPQDKRGRMIYRKGSIVVAFYADCCCLPKPSRGTDIVVVLPDRTRYVHCNDLSFDAVQPVLSAVGLKMRKGKFKMSGDTEIEKLTQRLIVLCETPSLDADGVETRAIGEQLDALGSYPQMLTAHDRVSRALGRGVARDLEVAWDGIGDWAL